MKNKNKNIKGISVAMYEAFFRETTPKTDTQGGRYTDQPELSNLALLMLWWTEVTVGTLTGLTLCSKL